MQEFSSLGAFIAHLAVMEQSMGAHLERGLEKSAQVIETKAKEELGYYQPAIGPFPAWAPLADRTLAQHAAFGVGDTPLVLTGELYASIEHETHGHEAVIGTKMEIGAYQEFGTAKIPPRPFMGPAALHSKDKIEKIMGGTVVMAIIGAGTAAFGGDE